MICVCTMYVYLSALSSLRKIYMKSTNNVCNKLKKKPLNHLPVINTDTSPDSLLGEYLPKHIK